MELGPPTPLLLKVGGIPLANMFWGVLRQVLPGVFYDTLSPIYTRVQLVFKQIQRPIYWTFFPGGETHMEGTKTNPYRQLVPLPVELDKKMMGLL